jgi:uncharacterized membrane protein
MCYVHLMSCFVILALGVTILIFDNKWLLSHRGIVIGSLIGGILVLAPYGLYVIHHLEIGNRSSTLSISDFFFASS